MQKTLKEVLEDKRIKNGNVKIGSIYGSSFFYCGKASKRYVMSDLFYIEKELKRNSKAFKSSLETRLKILDKIYEWRFKEHLKKVGKSLKEIDSERNSKFYKALMKEKEKERKTLPLKIESVQHDIDTPLLNRQVKEIICGISPNETPCNVIYIQGNEKGKYWTLDEYANKSGQYDEEGD